MHRDSLLQNLSHFLFRWEFPIWQRRAQARGAGHSSYLILSHQNVNKDRPPAAVSTKLSIQNASVVDTRE
jgi:hypothetical protein